jgi:hypothetical protein
LSDDTTKRPMWEVVGAIALIQSIQPEIKPLGYHVALAGGVLNTGRSDKDLDLVFVPLTNAKRPALGELCNYFYKRWGAPQENCTDPEPCMALRFQASYMRGTQRIDVFVV